MSVDSLDWPAFVLAPVRAEFDVIDPPELNDHLREIGERFLRSVQ